MLDTAVIPCGGLGTRLHPITRWLPKELLPVGLKPLPDNLFSDLNPTAAVLDTYRATGLATVLLTEVAREERSPKGATGRAAVRRNAGGMLISAKFYDVGVPEGYREAVVDFPARA